MPNLTCKTMLTWLQCVSGGNASARTALHCAYKVVGPATPAKPASEQVAGTKYRCDLEMHADRACLCAPSAARAPRAVMRKKPLRGTVHVSACPQKANRAATASARGRCAAGRPLPGLLPSQTCTKAASSDSYAQKQKKP